MSREPASLSLIYEPGFAAIFCVPVMYLHPRPLAVRGSVGSNFLPARRTVHRVQSGHLVARATQRAPLTSRDLNEWSGTCSPPHRRRDRGWGRRALAAAAL